VTGNPRKATNPANAILNYLYAIAEAESRIAALAVGCDPGLGITHADQKSRDSLACDLMEPVRPVVDAWVLDLLENRTFRRSDFFETREGVCRIMPPLTKLLAETAPRWAVAVAPIAEQLARDLFAARKKRTGRSSRALATPLTQSNRSAGRAGVRVRSSGSVKPKNQALPKTCVVCGADLSRVGVAIAGRVGRFSPETPSRRPTRFFELAASRETTRHMAAKRLGGDRSGAQLTPVRTWSGSAGNRAPSIRRPSGSRSGQSLRGSLWQRLMGATGLSGPYCAVIRRGARVPHPRHWEALRGFVS